MGGCLSSAAPAAAERARADGTTPRSARPGDVSVGFKAIADSYESLDEVTAALRAAGLEASQLFVAVDFTKSNTWTGKNSFGGRCLHALEPGRPNPYQDVISVIGRTLAPFDDDHIIPTVGFGDATTGARGVFPIGPPEGCAGFEGVLAAYAAEVPRRELSGPTNFAPAIRAAADVARRKREYTILLLICDGQCSETADTVAAIVEASRTAPLSIVIVGVGDGPWDEMRRFDDELPERRFDNLQFVEAGPYLSALGNVGHRDAAFAVGALQEIPEQYAAIRRLGLLSQR